MIKITDEDAALHTRVSKTKPNLLGIKYARICLRMVGFFLKGDAVTAMVCISSKAENVARFKFSRTLTLSFQALTKYTSTLYTKQWLCS
jgi:hypothetical protein